MKRLILHIGQHKTGSKALQSFLDLNREKLAGEGIFYPPGIEQSQVKAYQISHYWLYDCLLSRFSRERLEERLRTLSETSHPTVLLSAEDLFEMTTAHQLDYSLSLVARAAELLSTLCRRFALKTRVVVYLRRQDHSLASHYSQYVRASGHPQIDFPTFALATRWRLDPRPLLKIWGSAFGESALIVRPYEAARSSPGIVEDFFELVLGRSLSSRFDKPERTLENVNSSTDRDTLELIRLAHRYGLGRLHDLLIFSAPRGPGASIHSWLSPAQLQELLAHCRPINEDIARRYLSRAFLYSQPESGPNESWKPYSGPTYRSVLTGVLRILSARVRLLRSSIQRASQALREYD